MELIFKNEYTLIDFFVTGALATGGSVVFVALGVFAVGLAAGILLYWLDEEFQISATIIKGLKTHRPNKPVTHGHADNFWTGLGRISRG